MPKKLTELTGGTPELTDLLYAVKDPSGIPLDRKITIDDLATLIGATLGGITISSGQIGVGSGTNTIGGSAALTQDLTDMTLRDGLNIGPVSGATNNRSLFVGPAISTMNPYFASNWGPTGLAPIVFTGMNTPDWADFVFLSQESPATSMAVQLLLTANRPGESVAAFTSYINSNPALGDTAAGIYGVDVVGGFDGAGNIENVWFYHAPPFSKSGAGTVTNLFGLWFDEQTVGTNRYYSWFDATGVRRVRDDHTFDSVGQAIEALYNPLFTKYTAGAANYERVILGQWNGNVAEIGVEKGGTGTLRPLKLIGQGLQLSNIPTSSAGLPSGAIWANSNVLTIVP